MLRRILVLMGETPSSVCARAYAFRLVQETGAELAGLAGIDLTFIEARMPGVAGAIAYVARREEQLKQQADDASQRLHSVFQSECEAHQVPFQWLSFEGDPVETLYLAAEPRDLVVTGHDTAYYGNIREALPDMIAKLLMTSPRPMIVCSDEPPAGEGVLVAYDGSLPAMRAIQLFALLGIAKKKRISVTSIDPSQELAARRANGAANYLRSHGYEVEENPIATNVHPAETLNIDIADRKVGTLVMGAYGHRGFREFLFGSTTSALVEQPPCALFLYH